VSRAPEEREASAASGGRQLRELLQLKANYAKDKALESAGAIAAEELEDLDRLSRLVRICDEAQPKPRRRHLPIIMLFLATLMVGSLLLFTGPHSTEIEADLHVDQLSFALSQRQVLSEPLRLSSLGLTGIGQVQLPRAENTDARTLFTGRDFNSSIRLTVLPAGELALPELVLPQRSKVVVERSEVPSQYRLTLPAANVDFSVDVNGPVRVDSIAGQEHALTFLSPKSVEFKPQGQNVDLDLTLLKLPQKLAPMPLAVQDLSLERIDDRRGIEGLPARRASTILSGALYFEDLNGKNFNLRPGELIELDGAQGEIESLQLKDDIIVQFRGRVRRIVAGPADIRRSLMPTWLEWLKARQGLSLLWGSALYLFGLVIGVLRWWRGPE
jgi:hypothetical protein